jgi:hypothetical protein
MADPFEVWVFEADAGDRLRAPRERVAGAMNAIRGRAKPGELAEIWNSRRHHAESADNEEMPMGYRVDKAALSALSGPGWLA